MFIPSPCKIIPTVIFWGNNFILVSLAIACARNSPPSARSESPVPLEKYHFSERQLTPDEKTQSLSQLDQNIEKTLNNQIFGTLYQEHRTSQQIKEINAFIQSWASIDPDIAPFLGKRRIIENTSIYPSLKKGKVCILQQYYASPSDLGVIFSLGSVNNEILQTSSNQTLMARDGLLAVISIRKNNLEFSLLPYALPLEAPKLKDLPDIQKQFEESQCQSETPS